MDKIKEHYEPRQDTHTSYGPEYAREQKALEVIAANMHITVESLKSILSERIKPATTNPQYTALEEAHKVIYGEREQTYGDPGKNLRTIAAYWTNHLNAKYDFPTPLTVDDVCVMMVLLKQARLANSPKHRDSIVDTIGYMALADRVNDSNKQNELHLKYPDQHPPVR